MVEKIEECGVLMDPGRRPHVDCMALCPLPSFLSLIWSRCNDGSFGQMVASQLFDFAKGMLTNP